MKSDEMRVIDGASVPRPWKWTDDTLLWNEEIDHCVLQHGGTDWAVLPGDRAAIESALNHMPALIALVAACERRRYAIDARSALGSRSYREDPFSICSAEFKEQAASLDGAIRAAERDLDEALVAVHAVAAPVRAAEAEADEALVTVHASADSDEADEALVTVHASADSDEADAVSNLASAWRSMAREIPMSAPMANLHAFVEGCYRADLRDQCLVEAVWKGLIAFGAGSVADAAVRGVLESFVLQWVGPSKGPEMFLTSLARDVAVLIVALEHNKRTE